MVGLLAVGLSFQMLVANRLPAYRSLYFRQPVGFLPFQSALLRGVVKKEWFKTRD